MIRKVKETNLFISELLDYTRDVGVCVEMNSDIEGLRIFEIWSHVETGPPNHGMCFDQPQERNHQASTKSHPTVTIYYILYTDIHNLLKVEASSSCKLDVVQLLPPATPFVVRSLLFLGFFVFSYFFTQ